ncbi:MAG TPA: arginine deiminase family protein [Herpetosiphonaceae bacterium]|nr:arginine deiminase family protein [Herpetosiphonaceae bacterium]
MFTRALVRPPGRSFARGLTTSGLGPPIYELALEQHAAYCAALESCGLSLIRLEADERHPDSTFVEDTAILAEGCAVATRPGAPSRRGEVAAVRAALARRFPAVSDIAAPATVDGGDICQAGRRFFIGVTARTDEAGAGQLAAILEAHGYAATLVDIRAIPGLLHLKSGLASLGDNRLLLADELADHAAFADFERVPVAADEAYAANCVRVNGHVLVPAGYPGVQSALGALGYATIALDMSEFQKMDGGLSCLSLRF